MAYYIRYFIFIISFFLSITGYAVDHIICNLSSSGIPAQVQAGQVYTNTYTCINTYPKFFQPIQLVGSVVGNTTGTFVSGSCTTQKIGPGGSCQFNLNVSLQNTGTTITSVFFLQVSIGTLYYLNLPAVMTTLPTLPPGPVITITWPGSNIGFAEIDTTGTGFGAYVPNATDSSGHTITYTFQLSGAGTVIGNQNGSFTLTGIDINNPGTVTVTATADDAAPVTGVPIPIIVSNIPSKIIAIYNNTPEVLYPIIEAPILDVDNWLQAQFGITAANISTFKFESTRLHRVYTNPTGLQPGQSVLVAVPFYSELVPNPTGGNTPDQYVDWWNAMRVYLYDVQANFLLNAYSVDLANPDTLYTPGLRCLSGCTGQLPAYNSGIPPTENAIPANDPVQLTEYTFANVVTGGGAPYPIDPTHVDYDYSAVDQVYLPLAMGAYGNAQVGYTGTVSPLNTFRNTLSTFVVTPPTWPTYVGNPPYPYPRVPGAYNVVIGNQSLTPNAVTTTANLLAYWTDCTSGVSTNPLAQDCLNVQDLFTKNYANYQILCSDPTPVTPIELLQHVYGWVAFTCPSQLNNPLNGTPGANYNLAQSSYITLQYSMPEPPTGFAFNPYVSLIHTDLNMNVYAFSIDDAVGNQNQIGAGIVIAVGGATGLPNPNQFDPNAVANIEPGTPPTGSTDAIFTSYGICRATPTSGNLERGGSFSVQTVAYPCEITLQDSNQLLYHFTLLAPPPFTLQPKSNYISCAVGDTWCAGVNIDYNTQHDVNTPVPTP